LSEPYIKKEEEGRRKKEQGRKNCLWEQQTIKTLELQSFLEF
jgi:hypothetical protein